MYLFDAVRRMREMTKRGETFDVKFTHVNLSKNEGGHIGIERECLVKPVKQNRM